MSTLPNESLQLAAYSAARRLRLISSVIHLMSKEEMSNKNGNK